MRKILSYSFTCLMYIVFALFATLNVYYANSSATFYFIVTLIAAILVPVFATFLNKCKKIQVRRFYLLTLYSIAVYALVMAFFYLFYKHLYNVKFYMGMIIFFIAIAIVFLIYFLVYAFKDFFKRGYQIDKFDFNAFIMIINAISYAIFVFCLLPYGPIANNLITVNIHYASIGPLVGEISSVDFIFNFNKFGYISLFTSIAYIVLYVTIVIIYYFKFGRDER